MTFNTTVDAFRNTILVDPSTGETKATSGVLPEDIAGLCIVRGDERPAFSQKWLPITYMYGTIVAK